MKVGIFSGKFDPVHKGHIAFALEAATQANLDKVIFLPETNPRRAEGVTHKAHRLAMLKLATKPYQKLEVVDLPDRQFSVNKTMPRLKKMFGEAELYLLIGSDVVKYLDSSEWPDSKRLLDNFGLVVGIRVSDSQEYLATKLQGILPDRKFIFITTDDAHATSRSIRDALDRGEKHESALSVLDGYIRENWLYASLRSSS